MKKSYMVYNDLTYKLFTLKFNELNINILISLDCFFLAYNILNLNIFILTCNNKTVDTEKEKKKYVK